MRVAAVTLAFNDEGTIGGTIRCLKPYVDKHIVLISETPYFGENVEPDRTEEICFVEGVDVVKGTWALDNFQRSLGNILCNKYDWVLGFDSDEMITGEEINKLFKFLETTKARAISVKPIVYWKTTDYVLNPRPSYCPVIAMRPDVRFTHIRNIDCQPELWGGDMHHLSWCAPKDILKKVRHYAHATDFNGDIWYKTHYENWKEGDKYAVLPTDTFEVIKQPLPKELVEYLDDKVGV